MSLPHPPIVIVLCMGCEPNSSIAAEKYVLRAPGGYAELEGYMEAVGDQEVVDWGGRRGVLLQHTEEEEDGTVDSEGSCVCEWPKVRLLLLFNNWSRKDPKMGRGSYPCQGCKYKNASLSHWPIKPRIHSPIGSYEKAAIRLALRCSY